MKSMDHRTGTRRRPLNAGSLKFRIILILIVLAGIGIFQGTKYLVRSAKVHSLKPQLETYLALNSTPAAASHPRLAGGKVVCVCMNERGFDECHYYLPDDQRATKPEEVTAVVQVTRHDEMVGTYDNGAGEAYQAYADVVVVDKASGKVIGARTFEGGPPPERKKKSQSGRGSLPVQEIVDWLKTL